MTYEIPLFDLHFDGAEERALMETLQSKWISMGEKTKDFENRFVRHLDGDEGVAVSSCTAGLHLALRALGIGPGQEVIAPSFTFVATANAVRYVGATPVFADIAGEEDFSICPGEIEAQITEKTAAILVMHYGGFACQMEAIVSLAKRHNLAVIEDAAHAPDTLYEGKMLGTWGDIGCFSFFSNKNITCAEGGLVVTASADLAEKLRLLRSHGMTTLSYERAKGHATTYDVVDLGYNYRLDDLRASLLLAQLEKLEGDTNRRAELRAHYLKGLAEIEEIALPYRECRYRSSNYIFPILLKDSHLEKRRAFREHLAQAGIQTSVHYPAVHRFSIYKDSSLSLPKTEYAADNEVTLPLYYSLKFEEVDQVVQAVKEALVSLDSKGS